MSHFPSLVIDETVGDEVAKFSHRSLTVTTTRDVILLFHGWLRDAMVGGKYPYCYGVQRRPSFALTFSLTILQSNLLTTICSTKTTIGVIIDD